MESSSEVVQSAAAAASRADFTRALAQTAASMEAVRGLQLLASVHRSGLEVMDSWLYNRTAALLKGTPNAMNDGAAEEVEAVSTPPLEKWRIYQDEQRLHYARVPHDRQPALLRELPLAVLDEFIDNRKISYVPEADGTPRTAYLRARIAPAVLDASELDLLDWADERFRRKFRSAEFSPDEVSAFPPRWRFLARLRLNDLSVLDEAPEKLPEAECALHDALRAFREGEDHRHLLGDRTLWGFLELIAPAQQPRRLREHPFYTWWAVRRMLKALRNAHRAALHRDVQRHEGLLRAARDLASALREVPGPAHWEGNNALAYITLASGNRPERFEDARREMNAEARYRPKKRPQPFTGEPRKHFEDNLQLISRLAIRTEAAQVVNPYLLLGVEHGNEEWKTHWRRLRRILPEDGEIIANRAKDAIEQYERGVSEAAPFVLPLSPVLWRLPEARTGALCPSPSPLPRRTAGPAEDELAAARSSAAREIIDQIAAC
ncbi:hypothetical protein [Streptomyces sp. URMC 125]|uniref:hypothetical protein n=1 Tax=Streptomyces sp. URMC 125 TaxID=3423419 RepID=UPI003F52A861